MTRSRQLASRLLVAALALSAILDSTPARAASGSDGGFGYTWRDSNEGAVFDTLAPTPPASFNPVDNSAPGPVPLGISGGFIFYGVSYPQAWISDNGWVSFVDPVGNSYPAGSAIPLAAGPPAMLAPFWTDLNASDPAVHLVTYGSVTSTGGWMVTWRATDTATGTDVVIDCILHPDGTIKFQYLSAMPIGNATIGIERDPPNDGIQIAAGGVVEPGVAMTGSYVIEFTSPPILEQECALIPATTCGVVNDILPGTFPLNVTLYGCVPTVFKARERVYSVPIATTSTLDITLTGGPNLRAMLLGSCNERDCLRGPFLSLSTAVGPGTYYIAVDAPSPADEGPFTLTIDCAPLGTPLVCGTSTSGTNAGGPSVFASYACEGGNPYGGNEAIYSVNIPTATNLRAVLTGGAAGQAIFILRSGTGELTSDDCVGWGLTQAIAWNVQPGEYLVVVDAPAGVTGGFTLDTTCQVLMDCSTITGTIDFTASRVQTIRGDNSTATDHVQNYACNLVATYAAGEDVWRVDLPNPGQITVYPVAGFVAYYLLSACNEGACLGSVNCATNLPAGSYFLVVDSPAVGMPYEAMVIYEEQFNRWDACDLPSGATQLTDTTRTSWNFNDGAYCYDQPASHNFPDGCTFAMYATARCGTSLHLPLYDVESGHIRIFDVFNGVYVNLTAVSGGGWSSTGTDIQWQDPDCTTGADPRWNNVTTDVYFDRPDGLCGIFRLEFPNHSGFEWELYANCAGDRTPLYSIHDNVCSALADYRPLPNLSITIVSAVATCPDITVVYELKNDGCAPATDFPVILREGGGDLYTDIVPLINAGETLRRTINATFLNFPTANVELVADFYNSLTECSESPGAACDVNSGLDVQPLPGCIGACQVQARATVTPATICSGQPATINASSSASSLCPGGILEYQLRPPVGPPVTWQLNPVFSGLTPVSSADYDVDVRCADPTLSATCVDSIRARILVDEVPDFSAPSVDGLDRSTCNLGIQFTWSTAIFHGALGTGYYNIYRSTVSCADAVLQPAILVGYSGTTYTDTATLAGQTYYYVVEAEDSSGPSACVPRGPRNGGAVTRVDVRMGTCTPITDNASARPDLLPLVGDTLRVGGDLGGGTLRYAETFVEMDWSTDRPISTGGGEHFHVLRSAQPDTGFALVAPEPPRTSVGTYVDLNADDTTGNTQRHVWHYLVYTVDDCENDNRSVPGA